MNLRNSAILLGLLGVLDLAFIPMMTNGSGDEPMAPMPVVVLTALIGIASIAAAAGLLKGMSWAKMTGIGSRAIDILSTIPAFFVGLPTAEMVGAAVMVVLSVLSIYMLVKVAPAPTTKIA